MSEKPIIKTLENGLRVVYVPFEGIDSLSFRLMGRAGALWEKPEEYGIAHYIEHLAFDGTKKYPNSDDFRGLIENNGGFINAYTNFYEVNYQVKIIKEEMEKAFEFLSQQIIYPLLRKEDIEKQRGIIVQEHKMYLNNPVFNFDLNSQKHIYAQGSRFQKPLIGTFGTLKSISQDQIKTYFDNNYVGENFVLSICGDDAEKESFELATKYFSSMKNGQENTYLGGHFNDEHAIYTENNAEVKQATVSVIYPAPIDYTKEYYSTRYLNKIFGGGFMSRLFKQIREKNSLAYMAASSYYTSNSFGQIDSVAQVEPKNVFKVLKIIRKEVEKVSQDGITQQEYDRTRKSIISAFTFENEVAEKKADRAGRLVLEDQENENYDTLLEKYMAVTLEDVNRVAKEVFSHHPKFRVLSNKITDEQVLNAWGS